MTSLIPVFYKDYLSTRENFERFHNQVINMPRDAFSNAKHSKLKALASYLLMIEDTYDCNEGHNYKEILALIIDKLASGFEPIFRDNELEQRYFTKDVDIDTFYEQNGRLIRHLMGIMAFFGAIKSKSRQKKIIKFDTCREIALADDKLLTSILRNNWLDDNIKTNDYINSLKGIEISDNANYRPTYSILKYIEKIQRPATFFELSALLGRVDDVQNEDEILKRALDIASELPQRQDEQEAYFFTQMDWRSEDGHRFEYASSQQSYFKFRSFILYMADFGLLELNETNSTAELTEYSKNLLADEIPIELSDLEELLYKIDDDNENEASLMNLIIYKRTPQITRAIEKDSILIEKINKRALRNVEYDSTGKRKRNKFIVELAKVKAGYTCEATNKKTFKMPNGQYYVEAHHLIEFSRENGPDITENLIVLGPEKHMLLHHACREEVEDLYNHLKTNGVINIDRFRRMHSVYKCLTSEHIKILSDKKLISSIDKEDLEKLILES